MWPQFHRLSVQWRWWLNFLESLWDIKWIMLSFSTLAAYWSSHRGFLKTLMPRPPQTNDCEYLGGNWPSRHHYFKSSPSDSNGQAALRLAKLSDGNHRARHTHNMLFRRWGHSCYFVCDFQLVYLQLHGRGLLDDAWFPFYWFSFYLSYSCGKSLKYAIDWDFPGGPVLYGFQSIKKNESCILRMWDRSWCANSKKQKLKYLGRNKKNFNIT